MSQIAESETGTSVPDEGDISERPNPADKRVFSLCDGVLTCRDTDGVAWPDSFAGLSQKQLNMLAASDQYCWEEVFQQTSPLQIERKEFVRRGVVDGMRNEKIPAGVWRDLVAGGMSVDDAVYGMIINVISDAISNLEPHLQHALFKRPAIFAVATAEILQRVEFKPLFEPYRPDRIDDDEDVSTWAQ